jgi:hypothetical protein
MPRSLAIAEDGITTGRSFSNLMAALIADGVAGRITPQTSNAACKAASLMLKVVEMQAKFGDRANVNEKVLQLGDGAQKMMPDVQGGEGSESDASETAGIPH